MLDNLRLDSTTSSCSLTESQPVTWDGQTSLQHPQTQVEIAILSEHAVVILQTLSKEASAIFQLWIQSLQPKLRNKEKPVNITHKALDIPSSLVLSAVIYGPLEVAEQVGTWLNGMHLFLQDPVGCDRDVLYKNPHSLSFDDDKNVTTYQLDTDRTFNSADDYKSSSDGFADLYTDVSFDEAQQPTAVSTMLQTHQKQALTFMLLREKGWDLTGTRPDVWKAHVDAFGVTRYRNSLSGHTQTQSPTPFRGGIMADEMGLGKTCSLLSLIANNPFRKVSPSIDRSLKMGDTVRVKGSLVVVPFSLLQVWESQITRHFRPRTVQILIYYGMSNTSSKCLSPPLSGRTARNVTLNLKY